MRTLRPSDMRPSVNVGGIHLGNVNVSFELKSDDRNILETIRRNGRKKSR
ncbi:hypothetical protein [Paenibacillus puerhi]|nr:hypothetical protein [Paenibacillus puerhi]